MHFKQYETVGGVNQRANLEEEGGWNAPRYCWIWKNRDNLTNGAFRMNIYAYDPYLKINDKNVSQEHDLYDMISKIDVLVVCPFK